MADKAKTKVIVGPVRLSYVYLGDGQINEKSGKQEWAAQILIPKSDKKSLAACKAAIVAAAKAKFGDKAERMLKNPQFKKPIRDPEAEDKEGKEYEGMYFFNSKAAKKHPGVVLRNGQKVTDHEEIVDKIYSGCWAMVSLNFYGFSEEGSKGVAVGLNNIMKYKDDERLDGFSDAEDDFADFFEDTDDDVDALADFDDDDDDDFGL